MWKKHITALIHQMNEKQRYEEWNGIKILVKPIPEGGEPGMLDPRSYRFAKQLHLLSRFLFHKKDIRDSYKRMLPYRTLFNIRKSRRHYVRGIKTTNISIPGFDGNSIPGRVYRHGEKDKTPLIVYFHGGGFFGGGLHVVDELCRQLAKTTQCAVLSVDYRLCPEHPYNCLLEDCWAAVKWAREHSQLLQIDSDSLIVAGDSAGGTLAAATALRDRDEHAGIVKAQILLYPVVNAPGQHTAFYEGAKLNSYRISPRHARVLNDTLKQMTNMIAQMHDTRQLETIYLQGSIPSNSIYVAPLLDDFHELPPTLLIFGEHDMLAAEDIAYAKMAVSAGVECKTIIYEGILHGFADQIGYFPQAEDCVLEIADWIHLVL